MTGRVSQGFWMSDKPLVQQALAIEVAELILTINSTMSSLAFLREFWVTMVREWGGIDRLRCIFYRFASASDTDSTQARQVLHARAKVHQRIFQATYAYRMG